MERQFLTAFRKEEFIDLGLERYFPHIYRGLPHIFPRGDPSTYQIKKNFTSFPMLMAQGLDKALSSLYEGCVTPPMKVVILCYVMTDGLGDWVAGVKATKILKRAFPQHAIELVALVGAHLKGKLPDEGARVIFYDKAPSFELIPLDILKSMDEADWVLQFPTFFKEDPRFDMMGEYGFLESEAFNPEKGHRSMGLHALEKGIFIEKGKPCLKEEIENEQLKKWLQGSSALLYFAYLSSSRAGEIYLEALCLSLEEEDRDIDLCTPDLGWFFKGAIFKERFKIRRVEVFWGEEFSSREVAPQGKILRLLCPSSLSHADSERLMALSSPFVGVRGNQSLSEALSYGKAFFFDGRPHNRFMMKDLVALGESRLKEYPGTLRCLRMMREALLYDKGVETGNFVDELFFQEPSLSFSEIAETIALALKDPQTLLGYQVLSQIIREEASFNHFLVQWASRVFMHRSQPELGEVEALLLSQYALGKMTLTQVVDALVSKLRQYEKKYAFLQ